MAVFSEKSAGNGLAESAIGSGNQNDTIHLLRDSNGSLYLSQVNS